MTTSRNKGCWKSPELSVHGGIEEITAQGKQVGFADVPFPQDAPDLTASEPR